MHLIDTTGLASVKCNDVHYYSSCTQNFWHTQDGTIATSQHLPLRQEFVHSLCIAEQLGVLKSIEHIAKSLHERSQPGRGSSISSMATVEASLEAIGLTDSNSLEESENCKDSEPAKMAEDETSWRDTACKDEPSNSGPIIDKLKSSQSETVDSKLKPAAATIAAIDGGTMVFKYYGAGVGTFLT